MGAFFLFEKNKKQELNINDINSVFSDKGFSEPLIFDLGKNELHLYRKQLIDVNNYYINGKNAVFIIGTIVYKALGYGDTLKQLLEDYTRDIIDYDSIIGNYCAVFYVDNQIAIMNDALNACELFTDVNGRFITSSFLAAANAIQKITIDRQASIEKLLTGYIVGEETLFHEIKRIIPSEYMGKWNIHKWPPIIVPDAEGNREMCLKRRTENIKKYMHNIKKLSEEFAPELGLSGGYDSRLIFAAARAVWPFKMDIHTHSTEGVNIHDIEKEIVKEMAEKTSTKIQIIPTHNLDYYSEEEIENILKDGYYYFDGRCAYNMGAFSPTYTRQYKVNTVSGHCLTLNGLGGEVYRNYYINIKPFVSVKQWMKANIYPNGLKYVIKRDTFNKIHKYIYCKMKDRLSFRWGHFVTPFQIKRYYCEMRMPDCNALNCNANNQMVFYLTPFIEKTTITDAYKARRYTGFSGDFQADMIRELDSQLASFISHYGYPFDKKEPIKRKIYTLIRGLLPDCIWNYRNERKAKNSVQSNTNKLFFERVKEKCTFLHEASKYTETLFPELNFDYLRTDYAMMPNSSYISVVFYMLKDRIDHERNELNE